MTERRKTKTVAIGDVRVGGDAPISVQSMTNAKTTDIPAMISQLDALKCAGCDIVRVAVPDTASAGALSEIVERAGMPVVADIHFDHRLGLLAIEAGVGALRINPGNIGGRDRVRELAARAAEAGMPIRVGVNSGSLEKDILERCGRPTAEGMVESACRHVELLESEGFTDIIVSLKSSDVAMTVEANVLFASRCDHPLHIGVTEAGTPLSGAIRSAVGLGILLSRGIGDTIRVSLSGPVEQEVYVGRKILSSLGLRSAGVTVIACPTCARTELDVAAIAERLEEQTAGVKAALTVAVMGCAVNGPGEAREADVGIAGGGTDALLFRKGEPVGRIGEDEIVGRLLSEIRLIAGE